MPMLFLYMLYFVFFIILSEHFNYESAIAAVFAIGLSFSFLTEPQSKKPIRWHRLPLVMLLWIRFAAILIREIFVANIQVALIVLKPRMAVEPQLHTYTTKLRTPAMLTAFSTAITLTPGTMTVDIDESTLRIHCLTAAYAESLDKNPVEPILLRIEEALYG